MGPGFMGCGGKWTFHLSRKFVSKTGKRSRNVPDGPVATPRYIFPRDSGPRLGYAAAMNGEAHILVVDDHRDIRELLGRYLAKHGLRATLAEDAAAARRILDRQRIDLVVLDIMMPGEDGLSLCRSLREGGDTPVILLTAMDEDADRIVGLEIGADDYVTKPFNPRELLARIKAVLRRFHALPPGDFTALPGIVQFGSWRFDPQRRELTGEDDVVTPLSTGEFRILSAFLAHPGVVLSRDRLLDLTQGRGAAPFDRSIDNLVSRLRRKIEQDPKNPALIKTVWGGGYVLAAQVVGSARGAGSAGDAI